MNIPKIIHRVWFNYGKGDKPPKKYEEFRTKVEILHKNNEWIFMDWNESDSREFMVKFYPNYLEMWDGYMSNTYRGDAIRYFLLHHFGGFYIDQDIKLTHSLDVIKQDFPNSKIILTKAMEIGLLNNFFMASEKNHPFWENCFKRMLKTSKLLVLKVKNSIFAIHELSGPGMMTKEFKSFTKKLTKLNIKNATSYTKNSPTNEKKELMIILDEMAFSSEEGSKKNQDKKIYGYHKNHMGWLNMNNSYMDIVCIISITLILIIIIVVLVSTITASIKAKRMGFH